MHTDPAYDSRLGRIEGLREYGVGRVVSIAVGMDTTYVATAPYRPPPAYRLRELALLDLAREQQSLALYDKHMEVSRKQNRKVHMRKERQRVRVLAREARHSPSCRNRLFCSTKRNPSARLQRHALALCLNCSVL